MGFTQRLLHKFTILAVTLSVLAIGSTSAFATTLPLGGGGVLQLGNMSGTLLGVTGLCINWIGGTTCTGTARADSVSGTDTAVFTVPSTGTIKDVTLSGVLPLVDFETVPGPLGTVHFDLVSVLAPSGFPACIASPVCSTGSLLLTQTSSTQVGISLALGLEAYTGTSGVAYNAATLYQAIFTTQLSGNLNGFGCVGTSTCTDTIANVLNFEAGGGTIQATWSATETPLAGTPEPVSFVLFGSGLLGVAFLGRRLRHS